MKNTILIFTLLFNIVISNAQTAARKSIYFSHLRNDGLAIGVATGMLGLGYYLERQSTILTPDGLALLDKAGINRFDRSAVGNNSESARSTSDVMLLSCVAVPISLFFTTRGKAEKLALPVMVYEALAINGGVTSIMKATFKRYRPYTYNTNLPYEQRASPRARESFPSGHVSTTAAATFLSAKVFCDLYPNSPNKKYVWMIAATVPAVTGVLRYKAGKHFPSDLIAGYIIGGTIGYLVPVVHRAKNVSLTVSESGAPGIVVVF